MYRTSDDILENELEVVWPDGRPDLDYIRVGKMYGLEHSGPPHDEDGYAGPTEEMIVGWANVDPDSGDGLAPGGGPFIRRFFYVKSHDRGVSDDDTYRVGHPTEAIDPRTVDTGKRGEVTDRVLGPIEGDDDE